MVTTDGDASGGSNGGGGGSSSTALGAALPSGTFAFGGHHAPGSEVNAQLGHITARLADAEHPAVSTSMYPPNQDVLVTLPDGRQVVTRFDENGNVTSAVEQPQAPAQAPDQSTNVNAEHAAAVAREIASATMTLYLDNATLQSISNHIQVAEAFKGVTEVDADKSRVDAHRTEHGLAHAPGRAAAEHQAEPTHEAARATMATVMIGGKALNIPSMALLGIGLSASTPEGNTSMLAASEGGVAPPGNSPASAQQLAQARLQEQNETARVRDRNEELQA